MEPRATKAYALFLEQCSSFSQSLRKDLGFEEISVKHWVAEAHKVKGGAGFFGMSAISLYAEQIEKLLASSEIDFAAVRECLRKIDAELTNND